MTTSNRDRDTVSLATDVLVVGGGLAGLRAAVTSSQRGVRVTIVSIGKSASEMAGADLTLPGRDLAALGFPSDVSDTPETWATDIDNEGFHVNSKALVHAYTYGAAKEVHDLLGCGLEPKLQLGPRSILVPGTQIVAALAGRAKDAGVTFHENVMITDLVKEGERVVGAVGLDTATGSRIEIAAAAVVLSTGGCHQLFDLSTGPRAVGGDAQAMALRAGATLVDLEFVNFCPHIPIAPGPYRGHLFAYILSQLVRTVLVDGRGDALLDGQPTWITNAIHESEWDKLLLSYLIASDVQRGGGTEHGGVWFGFAPDSDAQIARAGALIPKFRWRGVDYAPLVSRLSSGGQLEVGLGAHFWNGGIRINAQCETDVPGLYAAGEATGGLFGANRVASAVTGTLVHGATAGGQAARFAELAGNVGARAFSAGVGTLAEVEDVLGRLSVEDAEAQLKAAARTLGMIREDAVLARTTASLGEALSEVPQVPIRPACSVPDEDLMTSQRLRNLLLLTQAVALASRARKESRGFHYRRDTPYTVADWQHANTEARLEERTVCVSRRAQSLELAQDHKGARIPYVDALREAVLASAKHTVALNGAQRGEPRS